jgi:hypothetical protein
MACHDHHRAWLMLVEVAVGKVMCMGLQIGYVARCCPPLISYYINASRWLFFFSLRQFYVCTL